MHQTSIIHMKAFHELDWLTADIRSVLESVLVYLKPPVTLIGSALMFGDHLRIDLSGCAWRGCRCVPCCG